MTIQLVQNNNNIKVRCECEGLKDGRRPRKAGGEKYGRKRE